MKEIFVRRAVREYMAQSHYVVFEDNFLIEKMGMKPDIAAFTWQDEEHVKAVAVECKGLTKRTPNTSECIRKAIAQAVLYQISFPLVYVGVPSGDIGHVERALLDEFGIGLLTVDDAGNVHEVMMPRHKKVSSRFQDIRLNVIRRSLVVLGLYEVFREEFNRKFRWSAMKYDGAWCAERTEGPQYGTCYYLALGPYLYFRVNVEHKKGILRTYLSDRFDPMLFWNYIERTRSRLSDSLKVGEIRMRVWLFKHDRKEEELVMDADISRPEDVILAVDMLKKHHHSGAPGKKSPGEVEIAARIWRFNSQLRRSDLVWRIQQAKEAFEPIYTYLRGLYLES